MEYRRSGNKIVLRIDKGEEVIDVLTKVCEKENVRFASVSAIGAANKVKVGLFSTSEKKYYSKELEDTFEITSLVGNVSRKNGEVYIHLHINVADGKQNVYGGHLNYCYISATCEMVLDLCDMSVEREFDDEIGLNLFKF